MGPVLGTSRGSEWIRWGRGLIHISGLELFDLNFWGVKMNAEHALELQVRHCKYVKGLSKFKQHALVSWKGWSPER